MSIDRYLLADAVRQIPQTDCPVLATGCAYGSGGVVAHAADGAVVSLQDTQHLARLRIELSQPQIRPSLKIVQK